MMKKKGCLIFLEGVDKSGKGTQWALVSYALKQRGYDVESFTFPDYSNMHGLLVDIALRTELRHTIPESVKALNYAVNRAYATPIINNALSQGKVVVCKRSPWSNVGYRVALKGVPVDVVRGLEGFFPDPNIALYYDIDESMRRARTKNGQEADDLEQENQERVRELFLRLHDPHDAEFSRKFPADYRFVIDARHDVETILRTSMNVLEPKLEEYDLSLGSTLSFVGMQEPRLLREVYNMTVRELFESYVAWDSERAKQQVHSLNDLVRVSGLDINPEQILSSIGCH